MGRLSCFSFLGPGSGYSREAGIGGWLARVEICVTHSVTSRAIVRGLYGGLYYRGLLRSSS